MIGILIAKSKSIAISIAKFQKYCDTIGAAPERSIRISKVKTPFNQTMWIKLIPRAYV